ncbi:MAG: polymer-forming cytoskeletal protein [Ignavibacteriae bacterium]|nr:MAG: polymer-forming cytoskeletal protein [Ignavibacteriota bacterium]
MFNAKDKSREFETPVIPKSSSSKDVKTLIGEGCKVEGNFFVPNYTRIDGIIKGDVTGESGIIIGNKGQVVGNLYSPEVTLFGNVNGNIETQRLELKKGSSLSGDISVVQLITEPGSLFNGKCQMKENIPQETENPEENRPSTEYS